MPSEVDLAGLWQLTNSAGNVSSFAMVPGEVHTDLVREGVLKEDPYFRYNDIEFRWIVWQDWTFTRTVELPAAFAGSDKIVLDCEGIDTVAIVRVNGLVVGTTDNMFRHYQFDVASALVAGTNTIQVEIKSPATYVVDAMAAYPYALPESTEPSNSHGILGRNYVRKEQCSYAWDWGPCFMPQGIWRPIKLVAWTSAVVPRRGQTSGGWLVHQGMRQWLKNKY